MRSELEKECRVHFRRMIVAEHPEYQENKTQVRLGKRYVRSWQHPSKLWFHIVLMPHPTKDKFTIEGGWDFNGRLRPLEIVEANDKFKIFERPILFRPNFFWSGKDYWWPVMLFPDRLENSMSCQDNPIEDCLPLVAPAIRDAAQKIKEYLIPIFEKVVKKQEKVAGSETESDANCTSTYRRLGMPRHNHPENHRRE
jgi:hypothetical protein